MSKLVKLHIPCTTCITLAICKLKPRIKCKILFSNFTKYLDRKYPEFRDNCVEKIMQAYGEIRFHPIRYTSFYDVSNMPVIIIGKYARDLNIIFPEAISIELDYK